MATSNFPRLTTLTRARGELSIKLILSISLVVSLLVVAANQPQVHSLQLDTQIFPGVTRELASFCAARPSLPIDLASMVVHVKRNTSFNYKLYLFSTDHIFQTGQVIPRADFRIHSFPVKIKHIHEFWSPTATPTFKCTGADANSRVQVPASSFNLRLFMKRVPLNPISQRQRMKSTPAGGQRRQQKQQLKTTTHHPPDLHWDSLPGDDEFPADSREKPTVSSPTRDQQLNKLIKFDRDDQVSALQRRTLYAPDYAMSNPEAATSGSHQNNDQNSEQSFEFLGDSILPIGSFSSFRVNLTYLVRKDFDQLEPQIVQIEMDAPNFKVNQVQIISDGSQNLSSYPQNEDYNFLSHKLLRDANTRITAINQIYEDWITRNFYTIVYIQRRVASKLAGEKMDLNDVTNPQDPRENNRTSTSGSSSSGNERIIIINERLVFRGSSIALLGADQLDYGVKAAAFITEKNGLHYYLEFLTTNKFHLCAVDWSRRPFKMIDSRQFPIKATRTQLDNEELLLCPPAVCYSNQPVDEIISYNRLLLSEELERQVPQLIAGKLSETTSGLAAATTTSGAPALPAGPATASGRRQSVTLRMEAVRRPGDDLLPSGPIDEMSSTSPASSSSTRLVDDDLLGQPTIDIMAPPTTPTSANRVIKPNYQQLDALFGSLKFGTTQLETKLHLRDWVWTLAPVNQSQLSLPLTMNNGNDGEKSTLDQLASVSFHWRYELARRNDIKVKPDTYGYVLTGHEIDASYRVYNELYLISANHLITINYTLANETVTSSHPLGEEFPGLSSTLIDPITGAFYDRYTNQIYFFKGDRYVGYDYATKRPLEDFLLQAPGSYSALVANDNGNPTTMTTTMISNNSPLVTSLPVVGILGRQHHVDGIYHDFQHDSVFIFTGMRFYSFEARKFKEGIFNTGEGLPKMHCINTHFLSGCHFDRAYPNPCREEPDDESATSDGMTRDKSLNDLENLREFNGNSNGNSLDLEDSNLDAEEEPQRKSFQRRKNFTDILSPTNKDAVFTEEQQQKLRSIAARGGLLDALLDPKSHMPKIIDPLTGGGGGGVIIDNLDPQQQSSRPQETVIIYLLVAMVGLTILITVAMIVILINWSRSSKSGQQLDLSAQSPSNLSSSMSGTNLYLANQHQFYTSQRQTHHPLDRRPQPPLPPPPPPRPNLSSRSSHRLASMQQQQPQYLYYQPQYSHNLPPPNRIQQTNTKRQSKGSKRHEDSVDSSAL